MSEQMLEKSKNIMLVTYGLFLAGLFLGGIPILIGVVIAYIKRNEVKDTIYYDHFNYLLKSFWVGFIGFILGLLLIMFGIGVILLIVVCLWYLVRVVYGLVKVLDKKPVNPKSWLV